MKRGVRQGCPIAPLLFILTSELLAKNIRQDNAIKGLEIPGRSFPLKVKMYADDTTFFLKDDIDYREVLSKIKAFGNLTGLKLNKSKSFAMVMSDISFKNTMKFGIRFVNRINILGIFFSNELRSDEIPDTVDKKIEQLRKLCALWSRRNIGMLGKITLLKTFRLSLFNYIMQSVGIAEKKLKEINSIMFSFIWKNNSDKKAIEKVKRNILCLDYAQGGLNMFDIIEVQNSYLMHWGERLLCNDNVQWIFLPLFFIRKVGGKIAFESNVRSVEFKGLDLIENTFWRNVLIKWLNNKNSAVTVDDENLAPVGTKYVDINEPLFNNKNITLKGKIIFKEKCMRKGICRIKDVVVNDRIITMDEFSRIYGDYPDSLLIYNVIFNSLNKYIGNFVNEVEFDSDTSLESQKCITFRDLMVGDIGRKNFLKMLKPKPVLTTLGYWERELDQFDVTDLMIWLRPFTCTKESYLRCLQWKIMHRIYPSGTVLKRMKMRESDSCQFCFHVDTLSHFFVGCKSVKPLWKEVERKIEAKTGRLIHMNEVSVLFGVDTDTQNDNMYVNKLILIAKAAISKAKFHSVVDRGILPIFDRELLLRKM